MASTKKIFVIDTNVILHDYRCIYNFQENDIVLPIVVLEELDHLKKGNDIINFHAREFTRQLNDITGDSLFNGGIQLGEELGKLFVETGKPSSSKIQESFPENSPDHRILAITEAVEEKNDNYDVILISKDINLRLKAKSLGISAQDYESDKVLDIKPLSKNIEVLENMDND